MELEGQKSALQIFLNSPNFDAKQQKDHATNMLMHTVAGENLYWAGRIIGIDTIEKELTSEDLVRQA
jgi:hypothetical protein